tara:strand:- start:141 stop:473 length:333 start_codon:yes stop_codon:yes gene_type:complete
MAYFNKLVKNIFNAWSDSNLNIVYEYTPSYDTCGSGVPTCMWADVGQNCNITIIRSPWQSLPGHYDCMLHITNMDDDGGPVTKSYYIASSDDYDAAEKALLIELLLWVEQ